MNELDPNRYRLAEAEHARIYRDVIRDRLLGSVAPAEHPTATILGGTPGTGKSSVARQLIAESPAAKISSDRVSKFHPEWFQLLQDDDSTAGFYVRSDAVGWVETALSEAAERRLPVLIDTALADPDRTTQLSTKFRQHGYSVHFALVAGPAAFSQIGVLNRHYTDRQIQGGPVLSTSRTNSSRESPPVPGPSRQTHSVTLSRSTVAPPRSCTATRSRAPEVGPTHTVPKKHST